MTRLFLIRHSEPKLINGVPPAGWELTNRGRTRAKQLGEYLAEQQVERFFSSSEIKAIQTAAIAAERAGITNVTQIANLGEHDRTGTKIIGSAQRAAIVIESLRKPNDLIYGVETIAAAESRFASAVDSCMNDSTVESVAIVAHGTVISAFVGNLLDIDPVPIWESFGLPGFIELEWPNPIEIVQERRFE